MSTRNSYSHSDGSSQFFIKYLNDDPENPLSKAMTSELAYLMMVEYGDGHIYARHVDGNDELSVTYKSRDSIFLYHFEKNGNIRCFKAELSNGHTSRGNYLETSEALLRHIQKNPQIKIDRRMKKFAGCDFRQVDGWNKLFHNPYLTPRDDETRKALALLDARVNLRVASLLSLEAKKSEFLVNDYNLLNSDGDANRATLDLLERHPWFLSFITVANLIEHFRVSGTRRHPDEVVLEYLHDHFGMLVLCEVPEGYSQPELEPFEITKQGVSAMAGVRPLAMRQRLVSMVKFYSALPSSWAHAFKNKEYIVASYYLSSLIESDLVYSKEDLLRFIRPFKGDLRTFIDEVVEISSERHKDLEGDMFDMLDWGIGLHDPQREQKRHIKSFLRSTMGYGQGVTGVVETQYEAFDEYFSEISDFVFFMSVGTVQRALAEAKGYSSKMKYFRARWLNKILQVPTLYKLHKLATYWHSDVDRIHKRSSMEFSSWAPLADSFVASNGVEISFLTNSNALIDEGSSGEDENGVPGLGHCVASYSPKCEKGSTHIASFRTRNGDSYQRLSTVEIAVNSDGPEIMQHKGKINREPPREAEVACREWMRVLGTEALPILPRHMRGRLHLNETQKYDEGQKVLQSNLIRLKRYFAPEYRGIAVEALTAEIRADINSAYENDGRNLPAAKRWGLPKKRGRARRASGLFPRLESWLAGLLGSIPGKA